MSCRWLAVVNAVVPVAALLMINVMYQCKCLH